MKEFLNYITNTDAGRVILGAVLGSFLPLLPIFLKEIGKIAKS